MYSTPVGYFLTFTVRHSWRHGDSRGSWRRGAVYVAPSESVTVTPSQHPPHFFTAEERHIVGIAIEEVCKEQYWQLHTYHVLYNHVHVVLSVQDASPEKVMRRLKAKATMRLRKNGYVGKGEKIWTQHGSTKYLFDENALLTTCEYVRNQ